MTRQVHSAPFAVRTDIGLLTHRLIDSLCNFARIKVPGHRSGDGRSLTSNPLENVKCFTESFCG